MADGEEPREADVVVVGAGSSGAVAAARLAAGSSRRIALLEAGPDFPDEAVDPPAFLVGGNLIGGGFTGAGAATPELDWGYRSEPVADGRRVRLHRGRVVGGTSMINGCVAVRGAPADFARWESLGAAGWSWAEIVPYYERVEARVPIRNYGREAWLPFQHTFVDAFAELGFALVDDMNAADAWGGVVGPWPQNRRNEVRQGTLITHVRPARSRANLTIVDRALVDRVLLDGDHATGVRYRRGGAEHEIRAGEVILCAGAYGSPAILQRSGIGPASTLAAAGIRQVAELPAGEGLRDHPQTLFLASGPPALARMAGPGFAVVARGENYWSFPLPLDEDTGMLGVAFALGVQEPLGSVRIAGPDPEASPLIDHRYREVLGSRLFDRAWADFEALCAGAPWRAAGVRSAEANGLAGALRARLGTAFHAASTCAIGSVVDPQLRVLGFEGLRVGDASVFPDNVTNNPNLTCLAVGERVADFALSSAS